MKKLTREQLYDLLWAKPTTEIAKELGVSDVWVRKVCKRANIPKPALGYWQKIAAGKVMKKIPLPPPLPLQAANMFVLGAGRHSHDINASVWPAPKSDEEPLPPPPEPPVFTETIDDVGARAEALFAVMRLNQSLAQPHPMTVRLLDGDERRANRGRSFVLSWEQPRFRHPAGKELLTALNRLFAAWTSLGAEVRVDGQTNQSISVIVLGRRLPLGVVDYQWEGNHLEPGFKPNRKFGLFWEYQYDRYRFSPKNFKTYREYDSFPAEVLRALLVESVVRAEAQARAGEQQRYEWIIERRQRVLKEREERRIEAIRLHEEAAQELRQKRIDLAEQALDRISRAERLRSLIAAFDEKVSHGNAPVSGYDQWRRWAVQYVQETDPRAVSLEHIERWISQFRLDE